MSEHRERPALSGMNMERSDKPVEGTRRVARKPSERSERPAPEGHEHGA